MANKTSRESASPAKRAAGRGKGAGGQQAAASKKRAAPRDGVAPKSAAGSKRGAGARPGAPGGRAGTDAAAPPVLLSGGNPQIAKADGDSPVQAYIAAMPGWKRDVGRRLDALIVSTVPNVRKAVRWNTPFYGVEGNGWFLGFHCITKYVKVAFFKGASLNPPPPVESKHEDVRYFHIHEGDWGTTLDEALLASWIKQASALPGEELF